MKNLLLLLLSFSLLLISCNPFFEPRDVDWKKEWVDNKVKLKSLVQEIQIDTEKKYKTGNNKFPKQFDYPFDDGFFIETPDMNDTYDKSYPQKLTIKFYVDRGLLDHYSAFIFTNDSTSIHRIEENVKNGGNDFKLESNWYMIND